MSKATLRKEITETRKELISLEIEARLEMSDGSIDFWENDSDMLADSVNDTYNCEVSQTEWYQENFCKISNEELIEELAKRFNGKVEIIEGFDKTTVKF